VFVVVEFVLLGGGNLLKEVHDHFLTVPINKYIYQLFIISIILWDTRICYVEIYVD
jgi:hypothetical protein